MRKKLIALLASGVMLAQAIPALAVSGTTEQGLKYFKEDFESYAIDSDYNGQNGWTTTQGLTKGGSPLNPGDGGWDKYSPRVYTKVLEDPNDNTNKTGLFYDSIGGGYDNDYYAAFRSDPTALLQFDPMNGADADGIVTLQLKWLQRDRSQNAMLKIRDGDKNIVDLSVQSSFNNGLVIGAPTDAVGGSITRDYNKGAKDLYWNYTQNVWRDIKFEFNFNTETFRVYYNGSIKADTFYFSTAGITDVDNILLVCGDSGTADIVLDDIYVVEGTDTTIADVPASPAVGLEEYDVSAVHNNTSGTVRFTSTVTGGDADAAGACVVPVRLFTDEATLEGGASPVAKVNINEAVSEGEKFGVDVTGIPAAQFDTQLIAKPFVVVGETVTWADYTQTTSVNAAIN